jgi:hypothetical protein
MDFKFVGKFVLTAKELLVWNLRDQPEQTNVVERPLTLDTGTDRISFSGAGDTHFTVWQAVEDPDWGATSNPRFILRAVPKRWYFKSSQKITVGQSNRCAGRR